MSYRRCLSLLMLPLLACEPKSPAEPEGSTTDEPGATTVALPTTGTGGTGSGSTTGTGDTGLVCDQGFEPCDPEVQDTDCCSIDPTGEPACADPNSELVDGQCFCKVGFAWCFPDDPNDLSCCEDGGTSGTSGGATCPEAQEPPAACDPAMESYFCTHPEACGPVGSAMYTCVDGEWQPAPGLPDDNCEFDGFDFSYGCLASANDPNEVLFECGYGPGTPCVTGDPPACASASELQFCTFDKLGAQDCLVQCTEIGDGDGVLYDHGFCGEQDGEATCLCCDEGDDGCPI